MQDMPPRISIVGVYPGYDEGKLVNPRHMSGEKPETSNQNLLIVSHRPLMWSKILVSGCWFLPSEAR